VATRRVRLRTRSLPRAAGLAWVNEWSVDALLAEGRVERVLDDWSILFPGLCLYYPPRRHVSPVLRSSSPRSASSISPVSVAVGGKRLRSFSVVVHEADWSLLFGPSDTALVLAESLEALLQREPSRTPPKPWPRRL
jgi:hypothetical protein